MNRTVTDIQKQQRAIIYNEIFFLIVHQTIVMSFSILGNIFLLFVIVRGNRVSRRRVSPVQLLLIHTCVADLLFATLSLGTEIMTLITFPQYYGSDIICKLMRYVQMFPMYASSFLLVAISADRYQAICRPLAHYRSSRYGRPTWLAAIAWSLALLFSIPQFFVWAKHPVNGRCQTTYGVNGKALRALYVIMFNSIAWLLPSTFAAGFYYCVCKAVRMSSAKPTLESDNHGKTEEKKSIATEDYIEELRKKSKGFRRQVSEFDRKRVQTVRLTITIVACNFFLWMPFCVTNVIQALFPDMAEAKYLSYFSILGNLNSCLNPWIYIFFNRSHVVKAFCGQRATYSETSRIVSFNKTEYCSSGSGNVRSSTRRSTTNGDLYPKKTFKRKTTFHSTSDRPNYRLSVSGKALLPRNNSETSVPIVIENENTSNPPQRMSISDIDEQSSPNSQ